LHFTLRIGFATVFNVMRSNENDAALIDQLRRKNDELEAALGDAQTIATRCKDILLAASHEMRTPLHAIGLHLEMINRLASAANNERALKDQTELARRVLDGYVRRTSLLLDASRIAAGVFTLNPEPIALGLLVGEIVELYSAKANFQHARIEADIESELVGEWDRAAVETILGNLVSNALKYGGGTPVSLEAAADASGNAVIRVVDSGPGIAMEHRERIFDRFSRAVSSNSTIAGYGLGLWVAQQLALLHGGSIVLDASRKGSTFVVTLPLHGAALANRSIG